MLNGLLILIVIYVTTLDWLPFLPHKDQPVIFLIKVIWD
ncbi:protein of unknown function [Xenorhabdus doucetiae]|uniref:Uncharacterized protein n=1 Tax=Xenorhabdus doucetiae TaxID=351671 RepID=A0A068QSG2_9GAMM|nr:protein of unknown function [Xenorhabdus doucetiae]